MQQDQKSTTTNTGLMHQCFEKFSYTFTLQYAINVLQKILVWAHFRIISIAKPIRQDVIPLQGFIYIFLEFSESPTLYLLLLFVMSMKKECRAGANSAMKPRYNQS